MYERSADIYDLVHRARGKDYAAEAIQVAREVRARNPGATSLLDVACGTGGHLLHLRTDFSVAGVELDAHLRSIASSVVETDCLIAFQAQPQRAPVAV